MNTAMIRLSLKYVNKNQKTISTTCKWIHSFLGEYNYTEQKLITELSRANFEKIKFLIKFNTNQDLLSRFLANYCDNREGQNDIIRLLIDNGANIRVEKDCVLRWASKFNHFDIVKLAIDRGANVQVYYNDALKSACLKGHFDIAKLLIENGANVHAKNDFSLRCASEFDHFDIVKLLIQNGANVQAEDNYSLRIACKKGYFDIAKLLIENGADIQAMNNYALRWSIIGDFFLIVELLLNNKIKLSQDNMELRLACQHGRRNIARLLIKHGANQKDVRALQLAKKYGHDKVIMLLTSMAYNKTIK